MPYSYETFGPFVLDEVKGQTYKQSLKKFWETRKSDERTKDLCNAVGVYVWTISKGKKNLPWNVGRTDGQGFEKRFVQKEMGLRYLRDEVEGGRVEVYILALRTPKRKFRKPASQGKKLRINDWLETMLIGSARSVNPHLRNHSKVKYLRDIKVDGYLNDETEKRSPSAKSLSSLFTVGR
ncbi:MAG: hypothetical protein ABI147_03295 [Acidobacteriaceae bacterium]